MQNDKDISQLVTESLHSRLSDDKQQELAQHLAESGQSADFARLSQLIQDSVIFGGTMAEGGDAGAALDAEVKAKLKSSIADAIQEKLSLSQAGLLTRDSSARVSANSKRRHGSSASALDSADASSLREVVSSFRLVKKLGEGGLGNVWLARDERLNRHVAVKELKTESLMSEAAWERFRREAEITGRLEHPNIVPLYQYGDDQESNEPFYVMRFVGKRTLSDAIQEHHDRVAAGQVDPCLGLHRLLTVFLDVCQAIAYAHSRGVVHRDIKPDNIALDNFGQVVVLDWGLAKLLEDGELSQQLTNLSSSHILMGQTLDGDTVGTPLYMAPEQARGEHDKVGRRTDVFGLGALLFAMLTGRPPHEKASKDSGGSDLKEVLSFIADNEAPRPRELRPNIPADLDAVCAKAMANKQHLRYESVEDLAADIERWMAGQSEKSARYETLRMEGRELRADLQSFVNDAERNVRFMSHLPPIQEIISAESPEELSVWRQRLTTIFRGLLEANPDYSNLVYSSAVDGQFSELVRVERHSKDRSSIRAIPKTRLRQGELNDYMRSLIVENPEEVIVSLVCDPMCEKASGCDDQIGLVAGIPVYDSRTEEVFGIILIGCDIDRVLNRQLTRAGIKAGEIVAACDIFHVMARSVNGNEHPANNAKVADVAPHFLTAVEHLQKNDEFIDEMDSDVYGARIWFIPNKHGLMYLLRKAPVSDSRS